MWKSKDIEELLSEVGDCEQNLKAIKFANIELLLLDHIRSKIALKQSAIKEFRRIFEEE